MHPSISSGCGCGWSHGRTIAVPDMAMDACRDLGRPACVGKAHTHSRFACLESGEEEDERRRVLVGEEYRQGGREVVLMGRAF